MAHQPTEEKIRSLLERNNNHAGRVQQYLILKNEYPGVDEEIFDNFWNFFMVEEKSTLYDVHDVRSALQIALSNPHVAVGNVLDAMEEE